MWLFKTDLNVISIEIKCFWVAECFMAFQQKTTTEHWEHLRVMSCSSDSCTIVHHNLFITSPHTLVFTNLITAQYKCNPNELITNHNRGCFSFFRQKLEPKQKIHIHTALSNQFKGCKITLHSWDGQLVMQHVCDLAAFIFSHKQLTGKTEFRCLVTHNVTIKTSEAWSDVNYTNLSNTFMRLCSGKRNPTSLTYWNTECLSEHENASKLRKRR